MSTRVRPVLFVTNHVPPDRAGAFAALHREVPLELALFGGRSHHATAGLADPGVPFRAVAQRAVYALAAYGDHAAVVCGTAGRTALPAALAGARRGSLPFVLWSALWGELDTPAHRLARPLLREAHRRAAVVVCYGPHVADHARAQGARATVIAPQAVDNGFWSAGATDAPPAGGAFEALWVGRDAPGKGLGVLLAAWRVSRLADDGGRLTLVGAVPDPRVPGVVAAGALAPEQLRNFYARRPVVVVPSIPTPSFLEPWGLVVNEAMNQHCAIIATDAVGAAAGGLLRDEQTGLVVGAGDVRGLAAALRRLAADAALRARFGKQGAIAVRPYTHAAWAGAFAGALRSAVA